MRYRIYELGGCGEIVSGADLAAASDEQSVIEAAEHSNRCGLEIWQGNRKVASISPPATRSGGSLASIAAASRPPGLSATYRSL